MKVRSSSAAWGALLSGRKALARFNNAVFVQVVYDSGMAMVHYDGGFWAGIGDTGNYHQALSGSHQQVLMAE